MRAILENGPFFYASLRNGLCGSITIQKDRITPTVSGKSPGLVIFGFIVWF
jgi:hypothetical protein